MTIADLLALFRLAAQLEDRAHAAAARHLRDDELFVLDAVERAAARN